MLNNHLCETVQSRLHCMEALRIPALTGRCGSIALKSQQVNLSPRISLGEESWNDWFRNRTYRPTPTPRTLSSYKINTYKTWKGELLTGPPDAIHKKKDARRSGAVTGGK
jgi:hypothetical protein